MAITKAVVRNYMCFRDFVVELNSDVNIIVGDNEAGKSTLLEAINLALTGRLNGRSVQYQLSPYLFNLSAVEEYLTAVRSGKKEMPPSILIEVYLKNQDDFASLLGTMNSERENVPGVRLSIEFDDSYAEEYRRYLGNPDKVRTVPIEYYKVSWCSFADSFLTTRSVPVRTALLDVSDSPRSFGTESYILDIIDSILGEQHRVDLSLEFRQLKEQFSLKQAIQSINSYLRQKGQEITDKELSVSVDVSGKTSWEKTLTAYLDNVPFSSGSMLQFRT